MNTVRERIASIRAFVLVALMLAIVTALAGIAIAQSGGDETLEQSNDKYEGRPGSAQTAAKANVPPEARAPGSPADWGAMVFESKGGLICVAAGPVQDGQVGRVTRDGGFRAMRPEDAPGNCGRRSDDLVKFGAMAFTHHSPSGPEGKHLTGIVYGVVAPDAERVSVQLPGGGTRAASLAPVHGVAGVSGAFSVPLPAGLVDTTGLVVVIERRDGTREELRF